jgi:hypothetical protein
MYTSPGTRISPNFPLSTSPAPYQNTFGGGSDAFIAELSADGSHLLYSSFLGGSDIDVPVGIALDVSGNLLVAGWTQSTNFPISSNAYQSAASPNQGGLYGSYGFVTKLDPTFQTLVYSTYLGGCLQFTQSSPSGSYWPNPSSDIMGLALDASGNAYVAGTTNTYDFPSTTGAYISSYSSSTNIPVGFVSKFDTTGALSYSTFLYGSDGSETDINAITVDGSGAAYVTGATMSGAFFPLTATTICDPTTLGAACNYGFITKFNASGTGLSYSTFLGPNNLFSPNFIALDSHNNAYVVGVNYDGSYSPVAPIEAYPTGTSSTLLLIAIDSAASTQFFSTYFGGTTAGVYSAGLAVTGSGTIYAAGVTSAIDIPTTPSAYQVAEAGGDDAFLFEIGSIPAPQFAPSPQFVQYPVLPAGQTSQPQSVLLRNMGSSPLVISSIATTGDFSQTNDCGGTIAAASNCTLTVSFVPTAPGTRSGSVVVNDNSTGSPHMINLQADAIGSEFQLSTANLNFFNIAIGSASAAQSLTITNSGNADLDLSNAQVTGSYNQSTNCPSVLASGASCQFQIVFVPTGTGTSAGTFSLAGNAFNSPQTISLAGNGVDFRLNSSPTSASVSVAQTATYNLSLAPIGGAFPNTIQLSCSGAPAGSVCSLSRSTVNLGAQTASVTLTIGTTEVAARETASHRSYAALFSLQGAGLFGIFVVFPKHRRKKNATHLLFPLVIGLLLFGSGCAGGTGIASQTQKGIAPGNYHITVTAESGGLQHVLPLTLSVQ